MRALHQQIGSEIFEGSERCVACSWSTWQRDIFDAEHLRALMYTKQHSSRTTCAGISLAAVIGARALPVAHGAKAKISHPTCTMVEALWWRHE